MARLSRLMSMVLLAWGLVAGALTAGEPDKSEEARLETLFRRAVEEAGAAYLKTRDVIVAGDRTAKSLLTRKRKSGRTWKERVMADILLERLEHRKRIERLIGQRIEYEGHHLKSRRIEAVGKALADRFSTAPMVLVEFIWKRNELERLRRKGRDSYPLRNRAERDAYAAQALDILGEDRAIWPLLRLLEEGKTNYLGSKTAAGAICRLGSPEVLEELIRIAETGRDNHAKGGALSAMPGCVGKDSLALLQRAATQTKDEVRQAKYQLLANIVKGSTTPPAVNDPASPGHVSPSYRLKAIYQLEMDTFLRAYNAQLKLYRSKIGRAELWKNPVESGIFDYVRAVKVLRAKSLTPLLVPHITYSPLAEDAKAPARRDFPVSATLKSVGVPAVPSIIKALKTIDPKGAKPEGQQARSLLIACLIGIYDQGGYGKELAKARLEFEMKAATGKEKDLLRSALEHPQLED